MKTINMDYGARLTAEFIAPPPSSQPSPSLQQPPTPVAPAAQIEHVEVMEVSEESEAEKAIDTSHSAVATGSGLPVFDTSKRGFPDSEEKRKKGKNQVDLTTYINRNNTASFTTEI
ncbi:hypothetical protein NW762_005931 [Fusarium torreyae]|uniref:Uncharacterized protein n=1 Tax=Fusarium torreyae TaxID=1237075 RepID=A0A9W8S120_9HYPO|nr:hypothetical protein NW762_005931 [Fusarium torreyae]